jgi:acrylyl-CoA reductase (NADPH)
MATETTFRALVLDQADDGLSASIRTLSDDDLPAGDVTVAISHSTLNYKDGMIVKGVGRLVRHFPHVPGIDFAGIVERSDSPDYKPGDAVILTGWRVGESHWGGYAGRARVKADWLVPMPDALTPVRAMALGTAGLTAMLAIMELEAAGLSPDGGEVLVTGANGGLGGVAVAVLGRLGYDVTASTGRPESAADLEALGAGRVIARDELATPAARPLLPERWAGAVDAVGGTTLANILASLGYRRAVAACGNTGGNELNCTVLPFLLRGVRLLGIDSVMCPRPRRLEAWRRLAADMPLDALDRLTRVVALDAVAGLAGEILEGRTRGRIVVEIAA